MSLPSLSVVMPNYNHARFLDRSLTAILRQSARAFETIVVDDASTDSSVEIIRRVAHMDTTVRLMQNERNMGVVGAVANGLTAATGEYVYAASADDEALPGFFEKSLSIAQQYPEAGFVWSDPMTCDEDDGTVNVNSLRLSDSPCYLSGAEVVLLFKRGYISTLPSCSCTIFKRRLFDEAGGFLSELRWASDGFLLLVVALRHGMCYIPEPLVRVRTSKKAPSYLGQGLKNVVQKRATLSELLRVAASPPYRDVCPQLKASGALGLFPGLGYVVAKDPNKWFILTPRFLRNAVIYNLRRRLGQASPRTVRETYYRIRDRYRASIRGAWTGM